MKLLGGEIGWLTIVLPAYDEALRLPPTLREIEVFNKKYPGVIRKLIVVDDGSKDNTFEVALKYVGRVPSHICRLPENAGKWAAIHEGMKLAETDAVLILDADGSAQINELARIQPDHLQWIRDTRTTLFGSRFDSGSIVEGKSFIRTLISKGYRAYVLTMYWYSTGRRDVSDMQCPFKLIWKSTILEMMEENRFCGDVELACCIQGKIENRPVRFMHMSGSKVRTETILQMFIGTWRVARRFRRLYGCNNINYLKNRNI